MEPHYLNEEVADMNYILEAEKNLNNHSHNFSKIFNIGEHTGQTKRCKDTLIVNHCQVPTLQGLRKDHKTNFDPVTGPPLRPLVDTTNAPNAPLSWLLSQFLKGIGDDLAAQSGTEALNSEVVCKEFEDHNRRVDDESLYPGNNDVDLDDPGDLLDVPRDLDDPGY